MRWQPGIHLAMVPPSQQMKGTKTTGVFGSLFFITQFLSLITYHSKYPTRLAPSLICHHSIFFTLFVGPIPVTRCIFFFFSEKKKKKKREKPILEGRRRSHLVWKEKEKKEDKETHALNPMKKKRKKDGQKLRLKSNNGSLHVVLFTEMLLSYELWKLKTAKMCF